MSKMRRRVVRLPGSMFDSIDQLSEAASRQLGYKVPRATVMRTAIQVWLDIADDIPALILTALHAARVKRGRKPRQRPAPVVAHEASA